MRLPSSPNPNPLCSSPRGPVRATLCSTFCGQTSLTKTSSCMWLKGQALDQGTELKITLSGQGNPGQCSMSLISTSKLKNGANLLLSLWSLGTMSESPLSALGPSWKLDKEGWRGMGRPVGSAVSTDLRPASLCERCFWAWPNDPSSCSHIGLWLRTSQLLGYIPFEDILSSISGGLESSTQLSPWKEGLLGGEWGAVVPCSLWDVSSLSRI